MAQSRPRFTVSIVAAVVVGLAVLAVVQSPRPFVTETTRAVESLRVGTPPNPNVLQGSPQGGPVVGGAWQPRVDHTMFHPEAELDVLVVAEAPANRFLGVHGTLLCDPSSPLIMRIAPPGLPFRLRIPSSPELVGTTFTAQAVTVDAGIGYLTNAIDAIIGAPPRVVKDGGPR